MTANFAILSAFLTAALVLFVLRRFLPSKRDAWLGLLGYALVFIGTGILGATGALADVSRRPPPFMFFVAGLLLTSLAIVLSPWGSRVIAAVPLRILIALQGFRFLPEILLDLAFKEGLAPIQMTWHGRNFDIVSAVTALMLAAFWNRLPALRVWTWAQSLLGFALLVNIITVAVLSAPLPFRVFMNEPANTFVAHFPYIWLPAIHVLTALTLHGLTFRRLLRSPT